MKWRFYKPLAKQISRKDMIFYGGTALRLAHNGPRFSEDLDFLMIRAISPKKLEKILQDACKIYPELLLMETKEKRNTLFALIKIRHPSLKHNRHIKIEISKKKNGIQAEYSLLRSECSPFRPLIQTITLLSLETAKIKAIRERHEPRDWLDLTTSKFLLKKLRTLSKTYFSINDIKKFYRGSPQSLRVVLSRYVKQEMLQKIMRGYFTFDLSTVDWEEFACTIKKPSYISLESALYHHGFIDQIPETLTLVTSGKSAVLACHGKTLEYAHIDPKIYFGYEITGNTLIAKKEKAILDEIYFMSLKKRTFTLRAEWLKNIDRRLFDMWLRRYPTYTKRFIRKIS